MANKPLVGLDGHRAAEIETVITEQRTRDSVGITARADLLVELIDEVAAVREDQDPAGARGINKTHRRDGLAGAGCVLKPEALVGVGIIERFSVNVLVRALRRFD